MWKKIILLILIWLSFSRTLQPDEKDWNVKMNEFRLVLSNLLPYVISDEQYNSASNFERIEMSAKKLAELAHEMPKGKLPADSDPSIGLISALFKDEIYIAHRHLQKGSRTYARRVLRSIPKYCIACHTRSASPIDSTSAQDGPLNKLKTSFDRAQYFDATWQFDRALDEFEKIINDVSIARKHQLDWQKAVYYGIVTSVRVKRNPDRALAFVNATIQSPAVPLFLRRDSLQWKLTLQDWKNEAPPRLETEADYLSEAKRLFEEARKLQTYPMDRNADILYLRATSVLHDFLREYPESAAAGEVLLMLGTCYEILQDLDLWTLHELYFETCIRKFPHSPIALACYDRYEQSKFVGYSGSAGMALPLDEKKRLENLWKLASPY